MNVWKIIYLNCRERYDFMIDHHSYTQNLSSCEIKAWKNSGLNGIRTHDLCNTSAVLYRLSYQAIWELVTLWVRNIPVEGEECKWINKRSYIWTAEKHMNLWWIIAVRHTTWSTINSYLSPQFKYILSYIHLHSSPSTDLISESPDLMWP